MTQPENSDVTASPPSEALKAVVRRNTEQVQGQGDFALFDELFADDFVDHTPQPGTTPDKTGVRVLYNRLRDAFPDLRPKIHWQTVDGDIVTTYKTYYGTHLGDFLGIAPTGKAIQFETVDAMRVRDGKITDHWGLRTCIPPCNNSDNYLPDCYRTRPANPKGRDNGARR
jgi:predicted ester cyclase